MSTIPPSDNTSWTGRLALLAALLMSFGTSACSEQADPSDSSDSGIRHDAGSVLRRDGGPSPTDSGADTGDGSIDTSLDDAGPSLPSCGDGMCSAEESCESCDADCGPCSEPTCGGEACLLAVDFEDHSPGEYTQTQMTADFRWRENWANGLGEGRTTIVSEGGNQFLRCLFRQHTRGHVQWQADLGGVHDDVVLEYRVRFVGSGFDFREGGKLPGLAGGTAPTGGQVSSDGLGFSARFMWRRTISNPTPFLTQYMYDMDKEDGRTGRHLTLGGSPIYVVPDRWYTIRSRVTMNTPGAADGRIQVWLDGTQVLDVTDARLRSADHLGVDMLYFSTFFGGSNTPPYQTSRDEHIDYDDFVVYRP